MSFRSDLTSIEPRRITNIQDNLAFDLNEQSQLNFNNILNHEDINVSNPDSVVINNDSTDNNSELVSDTERQSETQNEKFSKENINTLSFFSESISNAFLHPTQTKPENLVIGNAEQSHNSLILSNEIKKASFTNKENNLFLNLDLSEQLKIEQKAKNEQFISPIYERNQKDKGSRELKK